MRMLLALLLAVAFAVSPTDGIAGEKQITDVKELAGTWRGSATSDSGVARATMTVKEDGSYEASTQFGTLTVGKYSLEDGKLRYRSTLSVGTATISEERGRTFLTVIPEGLKPITGKTVYERIK
jgi:hypothetical protein